MNLEDVFVVHFSPKMIRQCFAEFSQYWCFVKTLVERFGFRVGETIPSSPWSRVLFDNRGISSKRAPRQILDRFECICKMAANRAYQS
jgi:hypothetical protein